MTQRILNAERTPIAEIKTEPLVTLDRTLTLPTRVIVPMIPPLMDQGITGSCVAHAAYILYGHHYKQRYGRFPLIGEPEILKFYDLCKKVDGEPDPERIKGTYLLTALRVMAGSGWPLADGTRGPKITGYEYVGDDYMDVKRSIAQYNDPILFAIPWDANWISLPANRVLKRPVGQWIGAHAMADFGYDDNHAVAGEAYADRNSWGRWSSGGNGMAYIRDEYKQLWWLEAWRVKGIL
jgi:hypothetical protein